jgi:hypothetical protein
VIVGCEPLRAAAEAHGEATDNYRVEPLFTDMASWLAAVDEYVGSLESLRSKGRKDLSIACHRHARTLAVAIAREALRVIHQTVGAWYSRHLLVCLGDPQSYMAMVLTITTRPRA